MERSLLRRLNAHGFHFIDLGLKKNQSYLAAFKIKEKILATVKRATQSQPKKDQFFLKRLTSPMMNFVFYVPKSTENFVLLGTNSLELGRTHILKHQLSQRSLLRYGYGLMVNGTDSVFRDEDLSIGVLPYLGIYIEPVWSTSKTRNFQLGLRLGHQFSSNTDYRIKDCEIIENFQDNFPTCSSPVSQVSLGVTYIESLRLQAIFQWMPLENDLEQLPHYVSLQAGWQF